MFRVCFWEGDGVEGLCVLDDSAGLGDGVVRVERGRWHRPVGGELRSGFVGAWRRGGLIVCEATEDEIGELRGGRVHRSLLVRCKRAAQRGDYVGAGTPYSVLGVLPIDRCKVSGKGRHGGKRVSVRKAAKLPDAIRRACGVDYYPRPMGDLSDVETVQRVHAAGRSVLLYGPPGTGKTALLEAAFLDHEYVPGTSDTEAADFVGTFVPEPGGGYRWIDGPLLRAMLRGVPLIIDEVALIDPRALSIVYAAMDGRRECYVTANPARGTVAAVDGFGVHAACNPDAPGARMSEALLSRFMVQIEYGTDYSLALNYCPKEVVHFARNLEARRIEGEVTWSPQMRELIAYGTVASLLGDETARANLLSTCPPMDRPLVQDLLSRALGVKVAPLSLGGEWKR